MIFFDGSCSSLHAISESLNDFSSWSGLRVNQQKSELFTAGVCNRELHLLQAYGFPMGELPIRYLGLPLTGRRLRITEYELLIDKLSQRFQAWAVRSLSFAGRIQLLNTVIAGLINFWGSTFILPKGCLKQIDRLCSRFLWSGKIDSRINAKVSWSVVCLPRQEGGAGLKNNRDRNIALCLKLIWRLFKHGDSLWCKWHKRFSLKGKSFWEVKESPHTSWNWRTLLRLRQVAKRYVRCNLGNGGRASFWYDNWSQMGPLINQLERFGPGFLRIPLSSKVIDVCPLGRWNLPQPRTETAMHLHVILSTINLLHHQNVEDTYSWFVDSQSPTEFQTATTWESLRQRGQLSPWTNSIWYKGAIPKQAFTLWVANLDRLPTKQRLYAWGLLDSAECIFCRNGVESRDHLFVSCPLARRIWNWSIRRLSPRYSLFTDWDDLRLWPRYTTTKKDSLLRKTVVQTVIYNIWRHRNNVIHRNNTNYDILRVIDRDVKNIISAHRGRKHWRHMMLSWLR